MFSPENEYDTFINCNSIEDADSVIRALKNEIEQLKNIMEHPDYNKLYSIDINYGIRLSYARKSIEKVKQYIKNKGGEYTQTEEERRAKKFEDKIPLINKVVIKFTNSANFNAIHTATLLFRQSSNIQMLLITTAPPFTKSFTQPVIRTD